MYPFSTLSDFFLTSLSLYMYMFIYILGSDRLQTMLDSRNWDDLPIYSAFALNSIIAKDTAFVRGDKIEYLDDDFTEESYINNIDIGADSNNLNENIVENEEDLGDVVEDENAYLLEIMNDTEQWLKDNM
jgi:hypothetical protein